ncbi:MAG TPA: glycosyltransferase, exosortase A system-associated [Planctomycetes bacterium]|nr:glycosyltransferase, exosortase A system-associated [Planctomycetota bacterium]
MRVLHLLDHSLPQYSGYSFRSRYILRGLKSMGAEVAVVTSARHGAASGDEEVFDGIRHFRTARPSRLWSRMQLKIPFWKERIMTAAMARRLEEVARSFQPDLIHAHSPFFNGQAAVTVGRRMGIPVVYEIRAFWEDDAVDKGKITEDGFVYRQVRRLESEVTRAADAVVCICEGLRKDLVSRGLPPAKITVVKNGVEPDTFEPRPKPTDLEERYGFKGKRVLAFIGSFFFYEGLTDLVRAVDRLRRERNDFALLLVGSGEDTPNVEALVRELGLEDVVRLTGRVPHEEVQDHYALGDFFIYPRRSKRLTEKVTPLKPLEAMAMERCTLGSDVGGIRELFEECGVGETFRAGDFEDLHRLLNRALDRSDGALREEGREGREAVQKIRTWDRTLQPVKTLYESLLGSAITEDRPEVSVG